MSSRESFRALVQVLTDQAPAELSSTLYPMVSDMASAVSRSEDLDDRLLCHVRTALLCTDGVNANLYNALKRALEDFLTGVLSHEQVKTKLTLAGFTIFARPTPQMVADDLVTQARARAREHGQAWTDPIASTDSDGDLVLEWLSQDGGRRLTIFVDPCAKTTYLRAWGPNIHTQMQGGGLESIGHLLALLKTLEEPGLNAPH